MRQKFSFTGSANGTPASVARGQAPGFLVAPGYKMFAASSEVSMLSRQEEGMLTGQGVSSCPVRTSLSWEPTQ